MKPRHVYFVASPMNEKCQYERIIYLNEKFILSQMEEFLAYEYKLLNDLLKELRTKKENSKRLVEKISTLKYNVDPKSDENLNEILLIDRLFETIELLIKIYVAKN